MKNAIVLTLTNRGGEFAATKAVFTFDPTTVGLGEATEAAIAEMKRRYPTAVYLAQSVGTYNTYAIAANRTVEVSQ